MAAFRRWANERDVVRYVEMIEQGQKAVVEETQLTKMTARQKLCFSVCE